MFTDFRFIMVRNLLQFVILVHVQILMPANMMPLFSVQNCFTTLAIVSDNILMWNTVNLKYIPKQIISLIFNKWVKFAKIKW